MIKGAKYRAGEKLEICLNGDPNCSDRNKDIIEEGTEIGFFSYETPNYYFFTSPSIWSNIYKNSDWDSLYVVNKKYKVFTDSYQNTLAPGATAAAAAAAAAAPGAGPTNTSTNKNKNSEKIILTIGGLILLVFIFLIIRKNL